MGPPADRPQQHSWVQQGVAAAGQGQQQWGQVAGAEESWQESGSLGGSLDDVEALPGQHRPSMAEDRQPYQQQEQQPWGHVEQQQQQQGGVGPPEGVAGGDGDGAGYEGEFDGMDEDEELPATPDAEASADMDSGRLGEL